MPHPLDADSELLPLMDGFDSCVGLHAPASGSGVGPPKTDYAGSIPAEGSMESEPDRRAGTALKAACC